MGAVWALSPGVLPVDRDRIMTDRDGFEVWVIDDDEAVRESLEALLTVWGYRIETCGSAEAYLSRPGSPGDCLLIDISMPGMDGIELLQRLSRLEPAPPVLVLTASREERVRDRALALGARAFLTKPVPEQTLLAALKDVLEGTAPPAGQSV